MKGSFFDALLNLILRKIQISTGRNILIFFLVAVPMGIAEKQRSPRKQELHQMRNDKIRDLGLEMSDEEEEETINDEDSIDQNIKEAEEAEKNSAENEEKRKAEGELRNKVAEEREKEKTAEPERISMRCRKLTPAMKMMKEQYEERQRKQRKRGDSVAGKSGELLENEDEQRNQERAAEVESSGEAEKQRKLQENIEEKYERRKKIEEDKRKREKEEEKRRKLTEEEEELRKKMRAEEDEKRRNLEEERVKTKEKEGKEKRKDEEEEAKGGPTNIQEGKVKKVGEIGFKGRAIGEKLPSATESGTVMKKGWFPSPR